MALVPIGVLYLASFVRLIALQGHPGEADAITRVRTETKLPASRGSILDRNGLVLAEDVGTWNLAIDAHPQNRYLLQLLDAGKLTPEQAVERVEILAQGTGVPFPTLWRVLMTDHDPYQVLRRGIGPGEREVIRRTLQAVPWTGLLLEQTFDRRYPNGPVLSHVIGFPNTRSDEDVPNADGTMPGSPGSGLELGLESLLGGKDGMRYAIAVSRKHGVDPALNMEEPIPGQSVRTTLDLGLSTVARRELIALMEEHDPIRCFAIAIDVKNGQILSMLGLPDYDPADPMGTMELWENPESQREELRGWTYPGIWRFSPGSTFKPLVAALALHRGDIGVHQEFENFGGSYRVPGGSRVINNTPDVEKIPMNFREGIVQSSNVVFAQIGRAIGREAMADMLGDFGYSSEYSQLPGLALDFHPVMGPTREDFLSERSPNSLVYAVPSTGFGRGIEVPPLDHVAALAALANGGVRYAPTLDPLAEPEGRRILSEESTALVRDAMRAMVMKPSREWLPHRDTFAYAGKSGTSEMMGGVYKGRYTSAFTAFGPYENPEVLVLVVAFGTQNTAPYGVHHYGSKVCGPAAANILQHALAGRGTLATNSAQSLDWRASEANLQRD